MRFLLAILVVFIHNNYTVKSIVESVENGAKEILFVPNAFSEWIQLFISDGIARCAVPLFFLFAAYLQARKNDSYGTLLKKKSKLLLVPYIIWLGIYFIYFGLLKILVAKLNPSMLANPDKTVFTYSAKDWIECFIGYYSGAGDGNPKFAMQFWFVRDLIIFTLISPVLIQLIKKIPSAFFVVISLFLICGNFSLNAHASSAVFYYSMGLYWGIHDFNLFEKIDKIKWVEIIFIFLVAFIYYNIFSETQFMSAFLTLATCVLLLKFSNLICKNERAFKISSCLNGFSFWLYAIHMPVLNDILKRLWLKFLPMKNPFFCLVEYFGVTILTIAIGTALGILLKKICPKLFAVLSGGR
ncbi:MAG: acyltransferase family protein [Treponema sp.]|nr:acyltransferase family protein [Spirochaetales bacterium]MDY5764663.1 acyltransferase family protein [Treponema sp.]